MRFRHIPICAATLVFAAATASSQTATKSTSTAARKSTARPAARPAPAGPQTDDEKTIYAIGLSIYGSLAQFNLSPADLDMIKRAMSDAAAGKPAVELQTWGPKIEPMMRARTAKLSANFLAKAAAEPGAVKTPSGLIYKEVQAGTGASPSATDQVTVNYRGTFVNGKVFDESKTPATLGLDRVIKCWTEGLQKMKVGGKARLVCPADIAYGAGRPGIPPDSVLVFDIELLAIPPK